MPTYEYACRSCGEHHDVVQKFGDEPLTECPSCGGPLRKVFGAVGVVFKGSGFYKTDSRASAKNGGKPEKADKAEKSEKSDKTDKTEKTPASSDAGGSSSSSSSGSKSSDSTGSGSGSSPKSGATTSTGTAAAAS
jgi:putative FmdB family regulatory protein